MDGEVDADGGTPGTTKQKSPEEATQMVELAVNIINAFATSLPDAGNNPFLVDRTPALIAVIPERCVPSRECDDGDGDGN